MMNYEAENAFNDTLRNLPALVGTEKQINWASSLRVGLLNSWRPVAAKVEKQISDLRTALKDEATVEKGMAHKGMTRDEFLAECERSIAALIAKTPSYSNYNRGLTETSAAWWIEHR